MAHQRLSPQSVIERKRDGGTLDSRSINDFVASVCDGAASEGQIAAFAMAVLLMGMDDEETAALTAAMRDSGNLLSWPEGRLRGPVVDKHSTGGVGDTVSLVLAPMLAAAGAHVPMISGRGLGHTGGTLDKLESIPGYQVQPGAECFIKTVLQTGCAIVGQSGGLAPADQKIYAVRDVTATIESVALITASILSKKLAATLDALVIDIKVGNGAFSQDQHAAEVLAKSIVKVGHRLGLKTTALLTDMNQPLNQCAGNALEIASAISYLTSNKQDDRLHEVVCTLGAELLIATRLAKNHHEARERLQSVLDDGSAAERFERMVAAHGGPTNLLSSAHGVLPKAPFVRAVPAPSSGVVSALDTRRLGQLVVELGGGRVNINDHVDPAVGLSDLRRRGEKVARGDPLCRVHARDEASSAHAAAVINEAILINQQPAVEPPLIYAKHSL